MICFQLAIMAHLILFRSVLHLFLLSSASHKSVLVKKSCRSDPTVNQVEINSGSFFLTSARHLRQTLVIAFFLVVLCKPRNLVP